MTFGLSCCFCVLLLLFFFKKKVLTKSSGRAFSLISNLLNNTDDNFCFS